MSASYLEAQIFDTGALAAMIVEHNYKSREYVLHIQRLCMS